MRKLAARDSHCFEISSLTSFIPHTHAFTNIFDADERNVMNFDRKKNEFIHSVSTLCVDTALLSNTT